MGWPGDLLARACKTDLAAGGFPPQSHRKRSGSSAPFCPLVVGNRPGLSGSDFRSDPRQVLRAGRAFSFGLVRRRDHLRSADRNRGSRSMARCLLAKANARRARRASLGAVQGRRDPLDQPSRNRIADRLGAWVSRMGDMLQALACTFTRRGKQLAQRVRLAGWHVGDHGAPRWLQSDLRYHAELLANRPFASRAPRHAAQELRKRFLIQPPDLVLARRVAWGTVGVLWFLWIAYEDQGPIVITFLSVVIAFASGLEALHRWVGTDVLPRNTWLARTGTVGLVSGVAVGPIAALLMLVKLGLHQHPEPDFIPTDFVQATWRIPLWAALGAAIGVVLGLLAKPRQD